MSTWRGDQLRAFRVQAGISQFNLAAQLGTTQRTIEAWERNEQVPSGMLLAELADAIQVDPTSLFEAPEKSGYRTHSKVSQSQHMGPGQAQEQAELAKLRQDVLDSEDVHARAVAALRAADPWDRTREEVAAREAGERLASLSAKLKAFEASTKDAS